MTDRQHTLFVGGTFVALVYAVALLFVAGAIGALVAETWILAVYLSVMAVGSLFGATVLLLSLIHTVRGMEKS